jgi:UDP-4-amino-4,6-dideoxy-L-N-acetyl-beta-L-altrosamine transaminase
MKTIPYGRQYIDSGDIKLVSSALKEDLITTGNYVKKFETNVKKKLGVKFTLTCSNGTSGLHLAFKAINLKKNDIVVMPAVNFIAAYNMCKVIEAKIFLADVDKFSGQMTPETLLACIKKNKIKKIKAILTMYMGGYPENVFEFYKIKKKFNCFLIEDACHALGAKYRHNSKDIYIGSCKHSDIAVFSLHPVKTITSGEGGLITTNDSYLAKKIFLLRSHGIKKNKNKHWEYNVLQSGFNYRLSDINCALALSQLLKIKKFIEYRKKIFLLYKKELVKFNEFVTLPVYNQKNSPSYHLFIILFNFKKLKTTKENFFLFLKKNYIMCQYHYIPIYRFQICKKKNYLKHYKSEVFFKNAISIPIYFNLKYRQQLFIIKIIKSFIEKNCR